MFPESTPDGGHVTSWQTPNAARRRQVWVVVLRLQTSCRDGRERAFLCAVRSDDDDDRCESGNELNSRERKSKAARPSKHVRRGLPNPGTGPDRYTYKTTATVEKDPQISPHSRTSFQPTMCVDGTDPGLSRCDEGASPGWGFPFSPPRWITVRPWPSGRGAQHGVVRWTQSWNERGAAPRCIPRRVPA